MMHELGMNIERERERYVCCASEMRPPNQLGRIANVKVKEHWEYCGTNEVEMM